jgi:hypothetical protein
MFKINSRETMLSESVERVPIKSKRRDCCVPPEIARRLAPPMEYKFDKVEAAPMVSVPLPNNCIIVESKADPSSTADVTPFPERVMIMLGPIPPAKRSDGSPERVLWTDSDVPLFILNIPEASKFNTVERLDSPGCCPIVVFVPSLSNKKTTLPSLLPERSSLAKGYNENKFSSTTFPA